MSQNELSSTLIGLGLHEKEAAVYLALLSLGPATILKIAQAAGVKRTTIYSIIESLKQKGLVGTEVEGFKKRFVAEPPVKLQSLLAARQEALKNVLPEFDALYNLKGGEGFIKYYEGLAGIKSVYENALQDMRRDDHYFVITDQKRWLELDHTYFTQFIERRAELARVLRIDIRILSQDSEVAREHKKHEVNYFEKIAFLPKETSLTTNLVITPRQIVIHQLIPPVAAIVIKNKSTVQMHKELFEIIWQARHPES